MISDSKLLASAAWDAQSLNELKAKAGEDPAANIRPVARQVEGMFVQMMLKSMRDALPKDGLFSSEHTRLYTSMYDQQIAQQMTAGKGLGLAEMMVKQMTPEQPLPEESTPAAPMKFPLETVVRYQNQALSQLVQKAVPRNYDDSLPGDSKAFLAQLAARPTGKPAKRCATSFDPRSGGAGVWLGATANPPRKRRAEL